LNVRSVPDYQSGALETIVIDSLLFGESYTFSATVANIFGTSTAANSASVVAGMCTQCINASCRCAYMCTIVGAGVNLEPQKFLLT
jgi:hypothetical protein